ncbi:MAG TPA: cytochrome P450 [Actinophytocola sp.]|uniref:cytochrome P450 family protein n=1 Tax=Actinophytocola sp. TaxID=1872138 RepID=UPI002DBDBEE5|nr:cytochrome P450 [Actinophytocola sp.]HEU5473542.1 cytochrome P450 [Actinophytocola sp.]
MTEYLDLGPSATGRHFHPLLDRLRAAGPVHRGELPDGSLVWLVTRYADVRAGLADPRLSLSKKHAGKWVGFGLPPVLDANLLNMDPPDHTRIRRLVGPAFGPRRIEALRPRIEHIAAELLAAIAPRGAADLVAAFAAPLPLMVICELLGIPPADRANLRGWTNAMLTGAPDADTARDSIVRLMVTLIRRKRTEPGDDLISAMVSARDRGDRLTEDELTSLAFLILVAGYEDPANLIGNGAVELCRSPALCSTLLADPDAAVTELLRYDTSAAVAPRRFPVEDMEIGGVTIRAGEPVLLLISSANRDPSVFPAAGEVRLDRSPNPHLSFGHGIHYCLGAGLARLTATIGLTTLVHRLPGLRLAVPEAALSWLPAFRVRSLTRLPVVWNPSEGES